MHPYCLRLAGRSWRNPKQSWEEGNCVSGVECCGQCSAGFPGSKLEGGRAEAEVLPCGCPCCYQPAPWPGPGPASWHSPSTVRR